MTNDILRLRDALVRDSEESKIRKELDDQFPKIRQSLGASGVYRFRTPKGTIVIQATKKTA
jgi:hypothetical protein